MKNQIYLYEILVPTVRNDGRPFRTRFHRVWDKKIRDLTCGLTIMQPAKGQWIDVSTGNLYSERMIPVRIACTYEQLQTVIDITIEYYDQLAVMAYRIADQVIIKTKKQ